MHRPGHVDDTGSGTQSMDRRKYLKALTISAVGTATAAAILQSCNTSEKSSSAPLWGYLSIYEPEVVNIAEAKKQPLTEGQSVYRIPFFNNNGIRLSQGAVIGFQLLKIGCPTLFVIATNLVDHDHPEPQTREWLIQRNKDIDGIIGKTGIQKIPWSLPTLQPC